MSPLTSIIPSSGHFDERQYSPSKRSYATYLLDYNITLPQRTTERGTQKATREEALDHLNFTLCFDVSSSQERTSSLSPRPESASSSSSITDMSIFSQHDAYMPLSPPFIDPDHELEFELNTEMGMAWKSRDTFQMTPLSCYDTCCQTPYWNADQSDSSTDGLTMHSPSSAISTLSRDSCDRHDLRTGAEGRAIQEKLRLLGDGLQTVHGFKQKNVS